MKIILCREENSIHPAGAIFRQLLIALYFIFIALLIFSGFHLHLSNLFVLYYNFSFSISSPTEDLGMYVRSVSPSWNTHQRYNVNLTRYCLEEFMCICIKMDARKWIPASRCLIRGLCSVQKVNWSFNLYSSCAIDCWSLVISNCVYSLSFFVHVSHAF